MCTWCAQPWAGRMTGTCKTDPLHPPPLQYKQMKRPQEQVSWYARTNPAFSHPTLPEHSAWSTPRPFYRAPPCPPHTAAQCCQPEGRLQLVGEMRGLPELRQPCVVRVNPNPNLNTNPKPLSPGVAAGDVKCLGRKWRRRHSYAIFSAPGLQHGLQPTWVAVRQQRADGQQELGDGQRWAPLVLERVEADLAAAVDVAVVNARAEGDLQGRQGTGACTIALHLWEGLASGPFCVGAATDCLPRSETSAAWPAPALKSRHGRSSSRSSSCASTHARKHLRRLEWVVMREHDV